MIGRRSASACASGDARLQPSEQVHVAHAFDDPAALERDRHVDVRAAPHEPLRHDADHGAHRVVQPQLAAEHVRVAAELPLPEAVAEHHHRLRAGRAHRQADGVRPISGGTPITSKVLNVP